MLANISDITVQISVLTPAPSVGLGRPVIITAGTTNSYKEYATLEELRVDHGPNTSTHHKAQAIFTQNNRPNLVAVMTYRSNGGDGGGIHPAIAILEKYFFKGWHFAILADYDADLALTISNLIEEQQFKFLIIQVTSPKELDQFAGNSLTIGTVHHKTDEHLDAALVGNTGNLTVGSVTWKGRSLFRITANDLSVTELNAIHNAGGIAYVEKAGVTQTSEGFTVGGEFIDALHGDHWIKASIETNLQSFLTNTDKVPFNAVGVALLQNELANIFDQAYENGIIDIDDDTGLPNYTITTLQRGQLNADDVGRRHYKGLSFQYRRSGAIHSVSVSGVVER